MIDPTWIAQRHHYWWNFLLQSQQLLPANFDQTLPAIRYTAKPSRAADWATSSWCEYNLAYWFQEGNKYDGTICHEVCHAFAGRLLYSKQGHSDLWRYFYEVACGMKRGRYHDYKRITRANIDTRATALCEYINMLKEAQNECCEMSAQTR